MKECSRCLLVTLCCCLLTILLAPHYASGQNCFFTDSSEGSYQGSCGNKEWHLQVTSNGVPYNYPYNPQYAYGTCTGGFYNCQDTYVQQGFIPGGEQFVDDGPTGYEEEEVHWRMDSWVAQFYSCKNGIQRDEYEVDSNYPNDTPQWEVFCG